MTTPVRRMPANDAYETHKRFWADSGGNISIPIDPYVVAERMGIPVYRAILGPSRSGFLDNTSGHPVIYVNEAHSPARNRFTVAHELGHYVDATSRGALNQISTFDRNELSASGSDEAEIYANRYAAALLMPKDQVMKFVDAGMGVAELSHRFNVSALSMEFRLKNLALPVR